MALITPDEVNPQGQIDLGNVKSPAIWDNTSALQLTVQDAKNTEAWMQNNYWTLRYREADALYQSPPSMQLWEGTTTPRANVNRFVVAETVNAIHPQILNGLFYETPSFVLRPRPNQDQNATRAITELLSIELDEMQVRQEVDWGVFSALLFGTGIWKWGFKSEVTKRVKYVQANPPATVPSNTPGQGMVRIDTPASDKYTKETYDEIVYTPTFENVDIRYVFVDPGCRVPDIRRAKFVIDRRYMTYRDLVKLADQTYINENKQEQYRYSLPSEKEIRSWFEPPQEMPTGTGIQEAQVSGTTQIHHAKPRFQKTTEDPLNEPLEVLERWDDDKVITVIQRCKIIRNEPNEFGCIPFFSVNWWPIPDAFWGIGLGRVIGVEQRVQAGVINACLDLASLIVNPMFLRLRGEDPQNQNIRQRIGGILTVGGDDVRKAFGILQQPVLPPQITEQVAFSQQRVEMSSGAGQQLVMGASPQKSAGQMGRSGTGAAGIIQATMTRLGGFVETFVRQVFEPLLYKMHELNRDKMPPGVVRKLLGETMGPDFDFDYNDFMNADAEFEVLAGSHLAAKNQMAQSIFMMFQVFDNEQIIQQLNMQGKTVDVEELLHMIHDLSGYKNYYSVVRNMTDQEKQAKQQQDQQNSPMAKAQAQMQLQNNKANLDSQIVDQQNDAKMVRDVFRQIGEKSIEPEILQGEPNAQVGMGSQEPG